MSGELITSIPLGCPISESVHATAWIKQAQELINLIWSGGLLLLTLILTVAIILYIIRSKSPKRALSELIKNRVNKFISAH